MSTQEERLNAAVTARFNKIRLTDHGTAEARGPQLVPIENEAGVQELKLGWLVLVTLRHNLLIGQPPVGALVPLAGVLPDQVLFEKAVEWLIEQCRQQRDEVNNTPAAAKADLANLPAGLRR